MKIHEYQGKAIFRKYNVPVPVGETTDTPEGAEAIARKLGKPVVVKAQIHAGGRGKAGGVKVCKTIADVKAAASEIMGKVLVTPQTGPQGKRVHKLWIEEGSQIAKEFYLGVVTDRAISQVIMMASTEGGMEIEEVAAAHPEKIVKVAIDPTTGYQAFHGRKLARALGLTAEQTKEAVPFFKGIYRAYMEEDCSQVEINPMILTAQGHLAALDAKINFDDNALYRHPETVAMRDLLEEILARHTGQSRERVHADTDRDFVMEASEALAYGIIDDVISSRQMVDRTGPIR